MKQSSQTLNLNAMSLPGTIMLALAIDLAAIIGWLRRRMSEEKSS
jgi:hypothetical protein